MFVGVYKTSSLSWQLRQLGQRGWEWVELQFSRGNASPPIAPSNSIPAWLIQTAFWLTLMLLLAWLGWQLYQLVQSYWGRVEKQASAPLARPLSPPEHPLTAASWWTRSQQLQQQGHYREACRALYMAMLQQLRDKKLIPVDESLTDGDYLTFVRRLPQPHLYQLLISTHERLYFGDDNASADLCDRCRRAYEEIAAQ
jgi:hypothetical protein